MNGPPHTPPPNSPLPAMKIELPSEAAGDEEFGGCRSIDRYLRCEQIGEGTYGQVFLAKDRETQEKFALKKIRMENEKEGFPITAIREIKLLKTLDHENVIRLKEIVRSQAHSINQMKGSIYMVFDYMDHDLTGLLERKNYKLPVPTVKTYVQQLLMGLGYCHKQGVLHRDLKAANLLINNEGCLKLADFGLARPYMDDDKKHFTTRVITLWYRPLELMLGKSDYGTEVDMWSVGCILAELLIGKALFTGKDEPEQCEKIVKICGSPNEQSMPGCTKLPQHYMAKQGHKNILQRHLQDAGLSVAAIDLLSKLLVLDPSQRLTAAQAYGHEFFWKEFPPAAERKDLPKYETSHEMDMKKRRRSGNLHQAHPAQSRPNMGGAHIPDAKRQRQNGPPGNHSMLPPANYPPHNQGYAHQRPAPGRPLHASMAPPRSYPMQPPAQRPAAPMRGAEPAYPAHAAQHTQQYPPAGQRGYAAAPGSYGQGQGGYDGYSGAYGGPYGEAPYAHAPQQQHPSSEYRRGAAPAHQGYPQAYNASHAHPQYSDQGYQEPYRNAAYHGDARSQGGYPPPHSHSSGRPPTYQPRR